MLTKRIIPCLDVDKGRVVKGTKFLELRDVGDPVEVAKKYNDEGADELVFLDITASHENRKIILDVVKKTAQSVFIPLTVGGGVRNLDDIKALLRYGADKVSINTAAVENPEFIKKACKKFGSQCIVVAIDAKRKKTDTRCRMQDASKNEVAVTTSIQYPVSRISSWEVYTYGGRKPTGVDVIEWAKKVEELGAGEILLTSMDRDGTKGGYDLELTKAVVEVVGIPVIASGGAGTRDDFYNGFVKAGASACLAASLFHFNEIRIADLKKYLKKKGVAVRL